MEAEIENSWFTTEKIDEDTFAISEYGHWEKVHSFLLLGKERAILIDTGLGIGNIKNVTDKLTKLPIIVITTHVHWDHIGDHGKFKDIYVHEKEEDWLINGIKGLSIEQIKKDLIRDITKQLPDEFDYRAYKIYQGKPAGLLYDGEIIDIGKRKAVIYHTPGHSPGHIAIFDEDRGYLFTGDLLYSNETPIYAFYPSTSPTDLVNSLEKICKLPHVLKIYGSHNKLGLEADILNEVKSAVKELREKGLVKFGTGTHKFNGFSIKF